MKCKVTLITLQKLTLFLKITNKMRIFWSQFGICCIRPRRDFFNILSYCRLLALQETFKNRILIDTVAYCNSNTHHSCCAIFPNDILDIKDTQVKQKFIQQINVKTITLIIDRVTNVNEAFVAVSCYLCESNCVRFA